jgi:hypothetical protein
MKLSKAEARIILALLGGFTLKSHRYLDGTKVFHLHPLAGPPEPVSKKIVAALHENGLIQSNQKFPAAAYLLTPKGRDVALRLRFLR